MPDFKPTDEQLAIIDLATSSKVNILVSALAGAAKTSTLILLSEALPKVEILCLAFNKKIAVEMQSRLPSNCRASTLNAIGHRVWADTIGTRLSLNVRKNYLILRDVIGEQPKSKSDKLWKSFRDILSTIGEAKAAGYIPHEVEITYANRRPSPLHNEDTFYAQCEFRLTPEEKDIVDLCLYRSYQQAFAGIIDFDDQILMPAVFRSVMPIHSLVFVDEAQDLSSLNHKFLSRLARYRIIAVGDSCQAIYGFRGAHESSMHEMKHDFNMTELPLSTSFRCPEAIVEHIKWRAPTMLAWDDNPTKGNVTTLTEWSIHDIPDSAAIICRNNAPLYSLAINFLREGRYPRLASDALGKTLIKHLTKLGSGNMPKSDCLISVDQWQLEQDRRSRAVKTNNDIADCMRVFIRQTSNLTEAIEFAKALSAYEGPVEFLTGHKAKGLEFSDVYFLDEHLLSPEGQDRNLRYVICSRSLNNLTYLNSEDCLELTGDGQ